MVDYFYRDEIMVSEATVLPLLALSRQLLVSAVDRYCLDFVSQHLSTSNCISYLRQAVKCNIQDTQQQCITLAARGKCFAIMQVCLLFSCISVVAFVPWNSFSILHV
eukprot:GHRR01032588.1.p2 GENE.GHRR01032588.1~~GHRR01032588.1.p2  ORF type:complete len:107 (-),score=28.56 GHRR01032588.1:378-698(-)